MCVDAGLQRRPDLAHHHRRWTVDLALDRRRHIGRRWYNLHPNNKQTSISWLLELVEQQDHHIHHCSLPDSHTRRALAMSAPSWSRPQRQVAFIHF